MIRASALGLVALVGCATTKPARQQVQSAKPQKTFDFVAAMKPESADLKSFPWESKVAEVSAQVLGTAAPVATETGEGYDGFKVPIGADSEVLCWVYTSRKDSAGAIKRLTNFLLDNLAAKQPSKSLDRMLRYVDAGTVEDRPYLGLETAYVYMEGTERKIGLLKTVAVAFPQNTLVCLHDQWGYRQTLLRVVGSIASSAAWKHPPATPRMHEVSVARVGDKLNIGFAESFVYPSPQGEIELSYLSALFPREAQAMATDSTSTLELDEAGEIKSAIFAEATSGELDHRIELKRAGKKRYTVKGEVQKEPIEASFDVKTALLGTSMNERRRKEWLRGGAKAPLTIEYYSPSRSPTKVQTKTYELDAATSEHGQVVKIVEGSMTTSAIVSSAGVITEERMPVGPDFLVARTVVRAGTP
jgi:hypothetical protein